MAKKQSAAVKKATAQLKDLTKELADLSDRRSKVEKKIYAAWVSYIKGIKPAVEKELRSLEWVTFTGRDSKGMRKAEAPANSVCLQVKKQASVTSTINSYRGINFGSFTLNFDRPFLGNKQNIVLSVSSLSSLGIKDKKKRLKPRTIKAMKDSGLSDTEIQEAVRQFKHKKKESE